MEYITGNTLEENTVNPGILCSNCSFTINTDAIFCPNCGFPEKGTEDEKSLYLYNREMAGRDLERTKKKIKRARTTLIVVSVFQFIGSIALFIVGDNIIAAIISLFVACVFFGLSLYGKKKPFPALLTALIVYVFFGILDAFADPSTIVKSIVVKSIIITFLIMGLMAALEARNITGKNNLAA